MGLDCQDLFIMRGNSTHYLWRGQNRSYATRDELIRIKGHDDVLLRVRESVYGPVISDLAFDGIHDADLSDGPALSLRWTSLDADDTTFDAFMQVNEALNHSAWQAARERYRAPSQNMVYADRAGNIAYQTTGVAPIRPNNGTGLSPVPGTGEFDWVGWAPFADMPRALNPKKGYVASANNAVVPLGYKVYITGDWDEGREGYRARRITDMIVGLPDAALNGNAAGASTQAPAGNFKAPSPSPSHGVDTMRAMQQDYFSGVAFDFARDVLPWLSPSSGAGEALLLGWRTRWDRDMPVGTTLGAQFQRWYQQLQTLAARETNATYWDNSQYLLHVLTGRVPNDTNCVWIAPNTTAQARAQLELERLVTDARPSCLDFASKLVDQIAGDSSYASEQWGEGGCHLATFQHQVLGHSVLSCMADRSVPHGGDFSSVNVGTPDADPSLAQSHGPSYRQIVDWTDASQRSQFMHGPGQSGNILSPHYDDLAHMWAQGEYVTIDPTEDVDSILTISPN